MMPTVLLTSAHGKTQISVETEYVLCSTVAQENSAFARCCVLGFAAA